MRTRARSVWTAPGASAKSRQPRTPSADEGTRSACRPPPAATIDSDAGASSGRTYQPVAVARPMGHGSNVSWTSVVVVPFGGAVGVVGRSGSAGSAAGGPPPRSTTPWR